MTLPPPPRPTDPLPDRTQVFLHYLDAYREGVLAKASALPEAEPRAGRLPSGWTPLELLHHLRHVELRWIGWTFEGRPLADPWGDRRDGRWHVPPGLTFADVAGDLRRQGRHTRAVAETHDLAEPAAPGPRWEDAAPPTLERILFHLLNEYARHAGHLDVAVELAGGPTGS